MKNKILSFLVVIMLSFFVGGCGIKDNSHNNYSEDQDYSFGPQVKKSSTGICHEVGSTYYNQTKNFTSYESIKDCLNSGGRLPKK